MNKYILLLFCIILSLLLRAQESAVQDKVTLKTGEVYLGKIFLKTTEQLMMTTATGMRFQFLMSEVKKVETLHNAAVNTTDSLTYTSVNSQGDFAAMLDVSAGMAVARYSFDWSPAMQLSVVFGNKNGIDKRVFVGGGLGYLVVFEPKTNNTTAFLPLYIRIQSTLTANRTAPYVGLDAGYGFALNDGNKGGELLKVYFGIVRKISYKSIFSVAIYAGIQAYNTQLIELNQYGSLSYFGKTDVTDLGCKISLQF
jgi:hypothetical protein